MGANLKGQDFTLSNFAVSFATGSLSSLASSGLGAIGSKVNAVGKFSNSLVGNMAFGGLVGGTTSAAMGGNFWEGFATGAIVSGLNHGLHTLAQTTIPLGRLAASYAASKSGEYFNKRGVQYKLVAAEDGDYPVYVRGRKDPIKTMHLKKGDTWKIGETTRYNESTRKQWRYTHEELKTGLGQGKPLEFLPEVTGTRHQIKVAEINKLYNYYNQHG